MEKTVRADVPTLLSCRYVLAYVAFLSFSFFNVMRLNLSIAIVCMVDDSTTNATYYRMFDWNKEVQGFLLSSLFYGYIITQIPGGFLADRYGGKLVFFVGMVMSGLATIFTHLGAEVHYGLVIMLRFIIGLGTGVVLPCMHSLWAKWAPKFERTKLITFANSGTIVGMVLTFLISGQLCDTDIGWPLIFYLSGGLCLLWCISWWLCVYDTPTQHPLITKVEVDYIEEYLAKEGTVKSHKIPWRCIVTSGPVWAIIVSHMANSWIGYAVPICMPMYFSDVLNFNIKTNGLYSSIPYIVSFICVNMGSYLADSLRSRGVRTVLVRKGTQTISAILIVITMSIIGYLDDTESTTALAVLTICAVGSSMTNYVVNYVDIAPLYAGLLFGISNTFATLGGMFSPIVVGQLTPGRTREEWQVVFVLFAGISLAGNIFYLIFGAGQEQEWARPQNSLTDWRMKREANDPTFSCNKIIVKHTSDLSDQFVLQAIPDHHPKTASADVGPRSSFERNNNVDK